MFLLEWLVDEFLFGIASLVDVLTVRSIRRSTPVSWDPDELPRALITRDPARIGDAGHAADETYGTVTSALLALPPDSRRDVASVRDVLSRSLAEQTGLAALPSGRIRRFAELLAHDAR